MSSVIALVALLVAPGAAHAQMPVRDTVLIHPSVRVTEVVFHPGASAGRHSGVEAEVGIVVEGELVLETPAGRQVLRRGAAYFLPGLTPHDVKNESNQRATLWDILLNRCE